VTECCARGLSCRPELNHFMGSASAEEPTSRSEYAGLRPSFVDACCHSPQTSEPGPGPLYLVQ
jgi:hypothetical protein